MLNRKAEIKIPVSGQIWWEPPTSSHLFNGTDDCSNLAKQVRVNGGSARRLAWDAGCMRSNGGDEYR